VSTRVEISAFRRLKIPPPCQGEGLQLKPVGVKMEPAGEAEAVAAGEQPAEESPAATHRDGGSCASIICWKSTI
jgi:hypothetical protein